MKPKRFLLHCDHCHLRFIEPEGAGALTLATTTYIKPCRFCAQPGMGRTTIRPYGELQPAARAAVDTKVS